MQVWAYIGRRLLQLLPQLVLILVATFTLIRMLPGDPARLQLGPMASQEGVDQLRKEMQLDASWVDQFVAYVRRMVHGDFGRSWVTGNPVLTDMRDRIPATLELMGAGLLFIFVVLVPLGIITASRGGGVATRVVKKISAAYGLLAGALPDFWLGLLFVFIFFTRLKWLPGPEGRLGIGDVAPDRVTGMYTVDALISRDSAALGSAVRHLVLPAVTLGLVYGAVIYKHTFAHMGHALRSNFTTYAEACGLPRWQVYWYAFRVSAPSIIVVTGVISGYLLGGAVLIETVFNLNGIGQYAVQSIISADYAPIQGFVLVAAVFTMIVYLTVDLAHFGTDPRVRSQVKRA